MSASSNPYRDLAARFGLAVLGETGDQSDRATAARAATQQVTPARISTTVSHASQSTAASWPRPKFVGVGVGSMRLSSEGDVPSSTGAEQNNTGVSLTVNDSRARESKILDAYRRGVPLDAIADEAQVDDDDVAKVLLGDLFGLNVDKTQLPGIYSQAWLVGERAATRAFEELRASTLTNVAARLRRSTPAAAWAIISLPARPLAAESTPVPIAAESILAASGSVASSHTGHGAQSVATPAEDLAQGYREGRSVRDIIERSRLTKGAARRQLIWALTGVKVASRQPLPSSAESRQLVAEFGPQIRDDFGRGLSVEDIAHRAGLTSAAVAWLLVLDDSKPLLARNSVEPFLIGSRSVKRDRSWPERQGELDLNVEQVVDAFRLGTALADIQRQAQLTFDELVRALLQGLIGVRLEAGALDLVSMRQFAEASGSVVVARYDAGASIDEIAEDLDVHAGVVGWSLIADPSARRRTVPRGS